MQRDSNCDQMMLFTYLILFTAAVTVTSATHLYNDSEIAAKIPKEVRDQIDRLLKEKIRLYMDTFFGDGISHTLDINQYGETSLHDVKQKPDSAQNVTSFVNISTDNVQVLGQESLKVNEIPSTDAYDKRRERVRRDNSAIDGHYSNWSPYGPCSVTCGRGIQQRTRTCISRSLPQTNRSLNCSPLGSPLESRDCNTLPCVAESYYFKAIKPIASVPMENIKDIKFFTYEGKHFLACLNADYLKILKWNETRMTFDYWTKPIKVQNGASLATFKYVIEQFIIVAETIYDSHGIAHYSRLLSYNRIKDGFDYSRKLTIPIAEASKVITFNLNGKVHVALIKYQRTEIASKEEATVCDSQTKKISCPAQHTLSIIHVYYGRDNNRKCPVSNWSDKTKGYESPNAWVVIRKKCHRQQQCEISAKSIDFIDLRPDLSKYLFLKYTCDRSSYLDYPRFYYWERVSFLIMTPSLSVKTYGAKDIEAFTIHHKQFVVVANYVNDEGEHHLDSEIYMYSSNLKQFLSFQKLRTDAAVDFEYFRIGEGLITEYFLVVANHFKKYKNGIIDYDIQSVIYKWNWNLFVPFQCIKTYGALSWKAVSGRRGQFLLTLTNLNGSITFYNYDGWRFYSSEIQPIAPAFRKGVDLFYSFNLNNKSMITVANRDISFLNSSSPYNLFEMEFERSFPRFHLLNETLRKLTQMNDTLTYDLIPKVKKLELQYSRTKDNLVRLNETNIITGHKIFNNVTIHGDLMTKNGTFWNVTLGSKDQDIINRQHEVDRELKKQLQDIKQLEELTKRTLKKSTNQTITGQIRFNVNTNVYNMKATALNVSGTVNGVDLSKLADEALYIDRNQTIYGSKTFSETVKIDGNITVKGFVDGINTSDIVTLTTNQTIYGKKTINGNIELNGGLDGKNAVVKGLIDNVNISKDEILLIENNQTITAPFIFENSIHVEKNIEAKRVNNVDLSDLYRKAVLLDSDQIIHGHIAFRNNVTINGNLNMSPNVTVDNVDVSELPNQIMSKTTDQNVTGSLYFNSNVIFGGPLNVMGNINGVKVPEELVFLSKQQTIAGEKTFLKSLSLFSNIDVDGLVNGINVSGDVMTINGNQTVIGEKTFESDIQVNGNIIMQNGKTVDGVDLSELANDTVYHNETGVITGNKYFLDLTVGNLSITCNRNCSKLRAVAMKCNHTSNCSSTPLGNNSVCESKTSSCRLVQLLKDLNEKTLKLTKPSYATGTKTFLSSRMYINSSLTVQGYINNIKIPVDLALINGNQTINGDKIFRNGVMIEGDVQADGLINGVNISDMYRRAMRLNTTQTITGFKAFLSNIHIRKDINLTGSIDGLDISEDAVTVRDDQNITGEKTFQNSVSVRRLNVESMEVEGLVDDVNLTNLNTDVLRTTGKQTIIGNVTIDSDLLVDNLTVNGTVNGVDFSSLLNNLVTIDGDQIITGRKTFTAPVSVKNSLTVKGLIDGVNISDFKSRLVTIYDNQTLTGNITFTSNVTLNKNMDVKGHVNGVNLNEMYNDALYKYGNQSVSGHLTFENARIEKDVVINGTVNGIDLSNEVVTLTGNETLTGKKIFEDDLAVTGDIIVNGLVNTVNITELNETTVRTSGKQEINSYKIFINDIYLKNNMTINGLIDGVNITDLARTILTKSTDQDITGTYTFLGNISFKNITHLYGFLNGVNLTEFKKNIVSRSANQTITGLKHFKNLTVDGSLIAYNINLTGMVNQVDLSELNERTVRVDEDQVIKGIKTFKKDVTIGSNLKVNGTINNLTFPDDIVQLSTNQSISGRKTFKQGINITGNLDADPNITFNGVDISELASNAVYLNQFQMIRGPVQFHNITVMSNMISEGLLDGINVSRSHLLFKSGEQTIFASKTFKSLATSGNLAVDGKINDVDVKELYNSTVLVNKDNVIDGEKTLIGNLTIKGNITAKLIDGVNVTKLLNGANERFAENVISKLNDTIIRYKATVHELKQCLQPLHQKLDYFKNLQSFDLPSSTQSFDVVSIGSSAWMVITDNRKCTNSTVYSWHKNQSRFEESQKILTNSAVDVSMFVQNGKPQAAVANTLPDKDCFHAGSGSKTSLIYSYIIEPQAAKFQRNNNFAWKWNTRGVSGVQATMLNRNESMIAFTNMGDPYTYKTCVNQMALLFSNEHESWSSVVSVLGCSVSKFKVINCNEKPEKLLLITLAAGLYNNREAVIYEIRNRTNAVILQKIPTFLSRDIISVSVNGDTFIVISNEYQSSKQSLLIDYSVPVKIYSLNKTTGRLDFYQDLLVGGARLIKSFKIDVYTYLAVGTVQQNIQIYQFMGASKFQKVGHISHQGYNNIKQMRTWMIHDDLYLGFLLGPYSSQDWYHHLRIVKAVKTGSTSSTKINKQLEEVDQN